MAKHWRGKTTHPPNFCQIKIGKSPAACMASFLHEGWFCGMHQEWHHFNWKFMVNNQMFLAVMVIVLWEFIQRRALKWLEQFQACKWTRDLLFPTCAQTLWLTIFIQGRFLFKEIQCSITKISSRIKFGELINTQKKDVGKEHFVVNLLPWAFVEC